MIETTEELASPAAVAAARPRPWTVLASGPFRMLWAATTLSLFGDLISYVAMAWLVLQLTGSSLALGTVLVVQALPRAVLMVVGGALADRISARVTMLGSMGLRALSVAPLAVLVLSDQVQMWQVYSTAILFGAWGVGATIGSLGAGSVPPPKRFGWLIVLLCLWLGTGISVVGLLPTLLPAALVMGLSGIGTGVVNTYGVSWLQRRTLPSMQGRVMSLVMLASMGLTPLWYAASGALAEFNPTLLFLIAGGMTILCGVIMAASRQVRSLT